MITEQMNFRMTQELSHDLDIVTNILKVSRSEWVKTKLAEDIHEEKQRLLMDISTQFAKGLMTKQRVEELVGSDIADEMEFIKKKSIESLRRGKEFGRQVRGKLKK